MYKQDMIFPQFLLNLLTLVILCQERYYVPRVQKNFWKFWYLPMSIIDLYTVKKFIYIYNIYFISF